MAKAKIIYLDQELLEQLQALSAQQHESVSAIIRQTLRAHLPRVKPTTALPEASKPNDSNQ